MESRRYCNNLDSCHDPEIIGEDNSAILVVCRECYKEELIGKDSKGSPETLAYSEFFKRELLQPDAPLFYKYAGAKGIRVV